MTEAKALLCAMFEKYGEKPVPCSLLRGCLPYRNLLDAIRLNIHLGWLNLVPGGRLRITETGLAFARAWIKDLED